MGTPFNLKLYDLINAKPTASISLSLTDDRITVAELIRCRVEAEVERHNAGIESLTLISLNDRRCIVEPEQQVRYAFKAFQQNGFFILVDDRQVESLDEQIQLDDHTRVAFLKLAPLEGG